jgi:predicted nucleic acid-binding protein
VKRAVLDASAAVHLVLQQSHARVLAGFLQDAGIVTTPDLFASEVANSLLKYIRHGDLSTETASVRLEEALGLIDSTAAGPALAQEALLTAEKRRDSAYDMMYAVLARRSGATVVTMDRRFALSLKEMDLPVFCPLLGEVSSELEG